MASSIGVVSRRPTLSPLFILGILVRIAESNHLHAPHNIGLYFEPIRKLAGTLLRGEVATNEEYFQILCDRDDLAFDS